jgi:hypothetical protein
VGQVLEAAVRRTERHLRRRDLLELGGADAAPDADDALAASVVSGREPPAGPQSLRGLSLIDVNYSLVRQHGLQK